ncbi:MAG: amino acid ABC transporter permease [Dongiaceae bacterium]
MLPDVGGDRRQPLDRPRWAGGFVLIAAIACVSGLGGTSVGRLIAAIFGLDAAAPGWPLHIATGLVIALAATGFALALRPLPRSMQTVGMWLALLGLFLWFGWSFDLKFSVIGEKLPFLLGIRLTPSGFLQGAAMTLFLCAVSIVCSTALGLIAALGRLSRNGVLFGAATFYISFFRGTPLLVQVFLIYLGLPQVGIVIDAVPAGMIALSLNYGAYLAEIVRAGIQSIAHGQWEAATALGLRRGPVMRKVILPQAMRVIVPPTGSQFIAMLKDSSLVSMMGVWEVMYLARTYGRAEYRYIEMLLTAAVIYWVMSICFELVQARIERHYGRGFRVDRASNRALPTGPHG